MESVKNVNKTEARLKTEDWFVEGGVLCNYPVHAYDGEDKEVYDDDDNDDGDGDDGDDGGYDIDGASGRHDDDDAMMTILRLVAVS